jgi:hypothetical protein
VIALVADAAVVGPLAAIFNMALPRALLDRNHSRFPLTPLRVAEG